VRAAQTADVIAGYLQHIPRHACALVTDRTPVPSAAQRSAYPRRYLPWLDHVPTDERDEDSSDQVAPRPRPEATRAPRSASTFAQ
jgi:probable phosphoglycerate mutase